MFLTNGLTQLDKGNSLESKNKYKKFIDDKQEKDILDTEKLFVKTGNEVIKKHKPILTL